MKNVKRLLCIILSVLMAVGSCAVFTAGAEGEDKAFDFDISDLGGLSEVLDGYSIDKYDVPDLADVSFDDLLASGVLKNVDVGGMTLDELYNSTEPINWKNMSIDSSVLYLAMGNLNIYFRNFFAKYYTKELLYSSKNASWLANALCDIFFGPDHPDIVVSLDGDEIGQQLPFIRAVLRNAKSGITSVVQLIQANWIDSGLNYLPLVYALGVDLEDIWNKEDAQEVLEETLIALTDDFIADPLYTVMDIIWAVCRTYNAYMDKPITAALGTRITQGAITADEIKQPHNVLNLIFNNNNKNYANDTENLQFLTAPYVRMGLAADRVELFYYLVIYAMLIGNYGKNDTVVDKYKQAVNDCTYIAISQTDKDYICELLEGFTSGDLSGVIKFTTGTFTDNIKENVDNWFQKIINRIKEIMVNFVTMLDNFFGFKDHWS